MAPDLARVPAVAAGAGNEQLMQLEHQLQGQRPVRDCDVGVLSGAYVVQDFEELR